MIKKLQKQQKMNCISFYPLLPLIPCRIGHLQKKKKITTENCVWRLGQGTMETWFESRNSEFILGAGDREDQRWGWGKP